jgi:hypothetical protein
MSIPRILKKFHTDQTITVDLGQSWKLYDNNKYVDTVVVYNGVIYEPKNSRKRSNVRINWIETDKGPFVIESDADYQEASKITKLTALQLRDIVLSNPIKSIAS